MVNGGGGGSGGGVVVCGRPPSRGCPAGVLGFKETTYLRSHGEKRLKRRDGGGGVKGKEKISRE